MRSEGFLRLGFEPKDRNGKEELTPINMNVQDIINAIPGGVAIYRVSDIFETVYFSDGVPGLTGYTVEEYYEQIKGDAKRMTYAEDSDMVAEKMRKAIEDKQAVEFEFRKLHRDGHIVWVKVLARQIGEDKGCPLLQCVFHNITEFKEAQHEMDHLVNAIPGGIASYQMEGNKLIPTFFSAGVPALTGHSREEFVELVNRNALNIIYEADHAKVLSAIEAAMKSGEVLNISYRAYHKNGNLIWMHLNGRRMGPFSEHAQLYAVFTGVSSEALMYQKIANETEDGIYVIEKDTYDLLYANEAKGLFLKESNYIGQKCYARLHGKTQPCEFCTLKTHAADGKAHTIKIEDTGRFYDTRFVQTNWNGMQAYIKYIHDVTEEIQTQKEKERLEQYFETVIRQLPGGVGVIRKKKDGRLIPEFLSQGFMSMVEMNEEEAWQLYREDAMSGVHPDDYQELKEKVADFVANKKKRCEAVYRLKKGSGGYVWVRNRLSMIYSQDDECRIYADYHDCTKERKERKQLRRQYNNMILQHYRTLGPDALIAGHCNITRNRILDIIDYTKADVLNTFGQNREIFFQRMADLIVAPEEKKEFLSKFLNAALKEAFAKKETQKIQNCFIQIPGEKSGRYVEIKVNLLSDPDTGDLTGVLTVTDRTEKIISEEILQKLSSASYDLVVDVDLLQNSSKVVSKSMSLEDVPDESLPHSRHIAYMMEKQVVPRDKEQVHLFMDPDYMLKRLAEEGTYSFTFSMLGEKGDVLTKRITVSAIDLKLKRICLARTDITDSLREQQGLLNVVAYTFELLGIIQMNSGKLTVYTRQTILENLSPTEIQDGRGWIQRMLDSYISGRDSEKEEQFGLEEMLHRLKEHPAGYDIVFSRDSGAGVSYKQINVLWGDENHKTVCVVQADVTDMIAEERRNKQALEQALSMAEEANRAKSKFLSSMSHDIRTPLNAIMGMTALAGTNIDNQERVTDCLKKISLSSRHLVSLINDILDMSKIEQGKLAMNQQTIFIQQLLEQVVAIIEPQAHARNLYFCLDVTQIRQKYFHGDALRINQILLNLLSNAVKFTPEGGTVKLQAEEIEPEKKENCVRYRFQVQDTGIGMPQEFMGCIFEPFARGSEVAHTEGTGLGLSIVKGLVEAMEGIIWVDSEIGKGSVFMVELEFEKAEEDLASAESSSIQTGVKSKDVVFEGTRILVAEDNPINAEIICGLLEVYGIEAVVKEDGLQTVLEFMNKPPGTYDMIFMDIQMPKMNGYEATEVIRKMQRSDAAKVPIVAMTANAFAEDVQKALQAGMTAHMAKPIDIAGLESILQKILKGY